jgi:hypothetical protein
MRNIQIKFVEKNKTHFMFSNFFFSKNRVVYEITWRYMAEPDRPQMTNTAHALCMLVN